MIKIAVAACMRLHIDPDRDALGARRAYESHLARAKWVSRHGYRQLLRSGWPSAR